MVLDRIMGHFLTFLVLFITALALGTVANSVGPYQIPWSQAWSEQVVNDIEDAGFNILEVEEVLAITEDFSRTLLDARSLDDYDQGHLPGSMSLSVKEFDVFFPDIQTMVFPEDPIVVYCSGPSCDEALLLARKLQEQGYQHIEIFAGGMEAWNAAEYPIE